MSNTNILEVQGLTKRFGERTAVDDVSFTIKPGESYGLLGPNGAGKTTTISMICGLLKKDGGSVTVAGQPLDQKSTSAKRAVGYVPQDIALYGDLSARENLNFWGKLYGLSGRSLKARVDAVIETIGLTDRANDRVSKYSGGMKRRLNIGAGLLHEPKLLVLDEPTVGVDPQSRNAILENVESLKAQGLSVLYTTHYMEEAERLCDRVGIIDEGKLIAEGTRRELITSVGEQDRIHLSAGGDLDAFATEIRKLDGVKEVTPQENGIEILSGDGRGMLPRLIEAASQVGCDVTSVEVFEPDLEAVFLHLTGKALRD